MLPTIPGLAEAGYLTNETVFDLTTLPASLLVIGGGPIGCEMAQALGPLRLASGDRPRRAAVLAEGGTRRGANGFRRARARRRRGPSQHQSRAGQGRRRQKACRDHQRWQRATIAVDQILTGIGRAPAVGGLDLEAAGVAYDADTGIHVDDFLRTTNPRIYAAGDVCLEHQFVDTADASARIVVRNALLPGRKRMSALTIPWCTYTDPEVAHVGLYVKQARERGIPVKTYTVPMHDVDRAIADGEEDGFAKIHVRDGPTRSSAPPSWRGTPAK